MIIARKIFFPDFCGVRAPSLPPSHSPMLLVLAKLAPTIAVDIVKSTAHKRSREFVLRRGELLWGSTPDP